MKTLGLADEMNCVRLLAIDRRTLGSSTGTRLPLAAWRGLAYPLIAIFAIGLSVSSAIAQTAPTLDGTPTTQSCSSCSSLSINLPSMNSSGDFIVVEVASYYTTSTGSMPSGYLLIGPSPTPGVDTWMLRVFGGFYHSGDPTTITFSLPSNAYAVSAIAAAYKGVNTFTPVDGGIGGPGQASSTTTTTLSAPAITLTQSYDTLLTFYEGYGSVNFSNPTPQNSSPPCDFTQGACIEAPTTKNGTIFSATFADNALGALQGGSQSSGNQSITTSASVTKWLAMQIALVPATNTSPLITLDQQPATTTYQSTAINTITLNFPSGVSANDICVAELTPNTTSGTITAPTGWSLIRNDLSGTNGAEAALYWYKSLGGGNDPSTFTWGHSVNNAIYVGWIQCFSGVNTSSPIDPNNSTGVGTNSTSATSLTVPAFGSNLAQSGEELILNCDVRKGSDLIWSGESSPYSEFTQFGTPGYGLAMGIYANDVTFYSNVLSTAAPVAQVCTQSTGISYPMVGEQIALQPAPTPTPTATATATVTPTETATATNTATATTTATASVTFTATATPTETATPTTTSSQTPTATATATVTPTSTATVTVTPTATPTSTSGGSGGQTGTINYVYDAVGRLVTVYDQSGNAAVYNYDLVGNLLSIANYSANNPTAFRLSSNSAQPGSTFTIYGVGFCSTPDVTINGVGATVDSSTSEQIVVTVPSNVSNGEIVVTCGSSTIDAGQYSLASSYLPTVTGFSPASDSVGSTITITGTNFQPGETNVLFNGIPALVTATSGTSITAVVPSNATSGPITAMNQYGEGTSPGNFIVLASGEVYEGQVSVDGTPTSIDLIAAGESGLLTFQGQAGHEMLIYLNNPDLCSGSVTVLGPNDSPLALDDNLCSVGQPPFMVVQVPSNGEYSIIIGDGFGTGSVDISVEDVSYFQTSTVAGAPTNVAVPAGQFNALTFQGTVSEQISFVAAPQTTYDYSAAYLVSPDGSTLASIGNANYLDSTTLPLNGTYLLIFLGSGHPSSPSVSLYNAPIIDNGLIQTGGSPITVTASVPGQLNYASFSGSAGEIVSYVFTNVNATGCFAAAIYDRDFNQVPNSTSYCQPFEQFGDPLAGVLFSGYGGGITLPSTGVYRVLLDPTMYTGSVVFAFNSPDSDSIAIGGSVTMNTSPGQYEVLGFSGNSQNPNQQVTLGFSNVTYNRIFGQITDSTNQAIDLISQTFSGSTAACEGPFSLDAESPYTIAMTSEPGAGSAQVSLYDATPVNEGSLTLGGGGVQITGNPGQPVQLTFSGSGSASSISISDSSFSQIEVNVVDSTTNMSVGSTKGNSGSTIVLSLPPLSSSDTYTVEITGTPTQGTAYVAYYQSSSQSVMITEGGPSVHVDISTGGQTVNLPFTTLSGADSAPYVSVGLTNSSLNGCVTMHLLDTQNHQVNSSTYSCGTTSELDATAVPAGADYSISIVTDGGTGSFDVQVYPITPITSTIQIDQSAVVTLNPSTIGQIYNLGITNNTGQQISLAATNFQVFSDCAPVVTLYDQSDPIDSAPLDEGDWPDGTANMYGGVDQLTEGDNYTLSFDASCGPMSVDLQLFSAPTPTPSIELNSGPVTVASNVPAQQTKLIPAAPSDTTPQSISITTANSTYEDGVCVSVFDSNNNYVDTDCIYDPRSRTMGPFSFAEVSYILVAPYGETGSVQVTATGN